MFFIKKELLGKFYKVNCIVEFIFDFRIFILLKYLYFDFRSYFGFCRGYEDSVYCWK